MNWLIFGSLAISVLSLARVAIPPQTRQVNDLTGRVEDLEAAHEDVRQRLTRRAQRENMAGARATKSALEDEAQAILENARAVQPDAVVPTDKAALRARIRGVKL